MDIELFDVNGKKIELDHILVNSNRDIFLIIKDKHLGFSIFNINTRTIEQLNQAVARDLEIIPEAYPSLLLVKEYDIPRVN